MSNNAEPLTKADYEALAAFRYALRYFVRFSEQGARSVGITPQQHQLMLAVRGQPGREWANVGEIAHFLQIQPHAAVGLINRCVQAGLVVRTPSQEDRRAVQVSLTEKGADLLAQLTQRNRGELQSLREALSPSFLRGEAGLTAGPGEE